MPARKLELLEVPGYGWQLKWSDRPEPLATSSEKWVLQAALDVHATTQARAEGHNVRN